MADWQQRVVLVTGGSTGLGREIAGAFAAQGARVIIVARTEATLFATADALRNQGGDVVPLAADVTVQQHVDVLFHRILTQYGRLDVLVNCAGRSERGTAIDTTPEQFQQLWELNFLSLVRCTRAAVPYLLAAGGHLVNIGSLASKGVVPNLGAYPASKFSVAAYSQQLRLELGPRGLHVLLVCPGPIARSDGGRRYDQQAVKLSTAAKKPGAGVKLRGIDPARLARKIVRACDRRRAELVVPGRARWLFAISQLWPRIGDWIVRKSVEK